MVLTRLGNPSFNPKVDSEIAELKEKFTALETKNIELNNQIAELKLDLNKVNMGKIDLDGLVDGCTIVWRSDVETWVPAALETAIEYGSE